MPPTFDLQYEPHRAAKTDQNFFKPRDSLFEDNDNQTKPVTRQSRNSNQKQSVDTNHYERNSLQQRRPGYNDPDEDFFTETQPTKPPLDPKRAAINDQRFKNSAENQFGANLSGNNTDLDHLYNLHKKSEVDKQGLQAQLAMQEERNTVLENQLQQAQKLITEKTAAYKENMELKDKQWKEMFQILKDNERDSRETLERRYLEEITLLKDLHRNEVDTLKEQIRHDSKAKIDQINSQVGQVLENMRGNKVSLEMQTMQKTIEKINDQLKDLKDRKEQVESDKKKANEALIEERSLISRRQKELDRLVVDLENREKELRFSKENLERGLVDREKSVQEREAEAEARENRLQQTELWIRNQKAELDSSLRSHTEKMEREKRGLEQRLIKVQEMEYQVERKMKEAIERENDSRAKQDLSKNKEQTIKLREEQIEQQKAKLQELNRATQKEKMEIQSFKDNFELEKTKNLEEQRRLNVFAKKLSDELEVLNRERTNLELMKKTLSNLRLDYTQELMSKMDRDLHLRQDIKLYRDPLTAEVPIKYTEASSTPLQPGLSDIDLYKLQEKTASRFDFEGYMNKLKYNY